MGTHLKPGKFDPRAAPNEPTFKLCGRDRSAPELVRRWANLRAKAISDGLKPLSDRAKVDEAMQLADDMEKYREKLDRTGFKAL